MWQERVAHERERAKSAERERRRLLTIIEDLETQRLVPMWLTRIAV
jgi:hypothetical protein